MMGRQHPILPAPHEPRAALLTFPDLKKTLEVNFYEHILLAMNSTMMLIAIFQYKKYEEENKIICNPPHQHCLYIFIYPFTFSDLYFFRLSFLSLSTIAVLGWVIVVDHRMLRSIPDF